MTEEPEAYHVTLTWSLANPANVQLTASGLSATFPPETTLETFMDWLSHRPAFILIPRHTGFAGTRCQYNQNTGKIEVWFGSRGTPVEYDPLDEESLAKMVRRLKGMAPVSRDKVQPALPGLPAYEQYQVSRYTNPMPAKGAKRPRKTHTSDVEQDIAIQSALDSLAKSWGISR